MTTENTFSMSVNNVGNNPNYTIENTLATMSISLHGAHITSFIPKKDSRERLWMSPLTVVDGSESIRGGIPVCWPWFADLRPNGDTTLPMHGFLRTRPWQLQNVQHHQDDTTTVQFGLDIADEPGFPNQATVALEINLGEVLTVKLVTQNTGRVAFPMTAALHTYFSVNNLADIQLQGVQGQYRDKTRDLQTFDTPNLYTITEQTDRIHTGNVAAINILEGKDKTTIQQTGNDSAVIWNPGKEETKKVSNIPDEDYQRFVCIESAVTQVLMVEAGETHTLTQVIG